MEDVARDGVETSRLFGRRRPNRLDWFIDGGERV